jgi:hypothetical protein
MDEVTRSKIQDLRDLVWSEDISSPTVPEYVEHHEAIQKILKFIDSELLSEQLPLKVDNYDVFSDRAKSLLVRWDKFHKQTPYDGVRCIEGFLLEVNDGYTSLLITQAKEEAKPLDTIQKSFEQYCKLCQHYGDATTREPFCRSCRRHYLGAVPSNYAIQASTPCTNNVIQSKAHILTMLEPNGLPYNSDEVSTGDWTKAYHQFCAQCAKEGRLERCKDCGRARLDESPSGFRYGPKVNTEEGA